MSLLAPRFNLGVYIFSVSVGCLLPSAGFCQSHTSADALEPYVNSHAFAGAVTLVANKSGLLDIDTVGWADVAQKTAMQENTLFWIASQSKPITAAALMILVDEGKVDLNSPVETYLPGFADRWVVTEKDDDHQLLKRPARAVTVRDILCHMSGLPFRVAIEQPTLDRFPLADRAIAYSMVPLQTEPGSAYQYSNVGINLAGRIIETVSGQPFDVFLDERLFSPLGMKDTTFWPNDEQIQRVAKTYRPDDSRTDLVEMQIDQLHYPLTDRNIRFAMPAGGLFSTARDVARFCQMILNEGELDGRRYLSPDSVRQMIVKQTPDHIEQGYGLGWQVSNAGYGHGGAVSTNMNIDPSRGLITVFMVQHAGFPLNGNETLGVFRNSANSKFAP